MTIPSDLLDLPALAALATLDLEGLGLRWVDRPNGERAGAALADEARPMEIGTLWPGDTWAASAALDRAPRDRPGRPPRCAGRD